MNDEFQKQVEVEKEKIRKEIIARKFIYQYLVRVFGTNDVICYYEVDSFVFDIHIIKLNLFIDFCPFDDLKRNYAEKNKLNYVVFWDNNLRDFKLWCAMGCPVGHDYNKKYTWLYKK